MLQRFYRSAYQMIYLPLLCIAGLALIFFQHGERAALLSTVWGGLAWVVPSMLFVWKVFGKKVQQIDRQMLYNFYFAEMIKFAISIFLIILMVKLFSIRFLPFLSGYAGAIFGGIWGQVWYFTGKAKLNRSRP